MPASASGVREYLWIIKESALGVTKTTPVAGTDSFYIRLPESTSFPMYAAPLIEKIPYGGGLAIMSDFVTDHYECKGNLKTKLYPTQAKFLLDWATTRINTGQTLPWVTTEPAGDLASATVYHAVRRSDGTFKRKKYLGVKVAGASIDISRSSTIASISLDLVGGQCYGQAADGSSDPDATEFPPPIESDYPTGPYKFSQTRGGVTIDSVRTQYEDLSIKWTNALDSKFFEGNYVTVNQFCGRMSALDINLYLKASPDDRAVFEAMTPKTVTLVFTTGIATTNMTLTYYGRNYITALPYDLPLGQVFMLKMSLENAWDATAESGAGGDFKATFA